MSRATTSALVLPVPVSGVSTFAGGVTGDNAGLCFPCPDFLGSFGFRRIFLVLVEVFFFDDFRLATQARKLFDQWLTLD